MDAVSSVDQLSLLVVEDDEFTRLSLVGALRAEGYRVVGDTAYAGEAAELADRERPHVAILDLHLGEGPTGIDLARALRRDNPRIGIVILTSYEDPRMLGASMPDPPAGTQYLTKKSVGTIRVLHEAIRASLGSRSVAPSRTAPSSMGDLTDTQLEVLRLIAEGFSNQHIAASRDVTLKSVEATIARIAKTLELPTGPEFNQRALLARAYFQLGKS